jgi:hypothetical protein
VIQYGCDDTEIFEGTPRSVRVQLLLRFRFLRRRGARSRACVSELVGYINAMQAYSASVDVVVS